MVIVSGFLGSGKTSTILSAIPLIGARGKKVAVIVNDFGQIGIDAKVMQRYGLDVKELAGGCICCTLGASLLTTIQKLGAAFQPNLIIMEPTGIADPGSILSNMEKYQGPPVNAIRVIHIIDAPRFEAIIGAMGRIFAKHMEAADVVVINKMDEVEEKDLRSIEGRVREQGFKGRIIWASAETGERVDEIAGAMLGEG